MSGSFFVNDTGTTESYTLALHDALPIWREGNERKRFAGERERETGEGGGWCDGAAGANECTGWGNEG